MDKEVLKSLIEFFAKLEVIEKRREDWMSKIRNPLNAIRNYMEQLQHVTSLEIDNAEVFQIAGFRDRLIFKIHEGLEKEVQKIQDYLFKLNNDCGELNTKLKKLEETRSKVSLNDTNMEQLVNGTPYRPKLNSLLQWAIDACNHYRDLYCRIKKGLGGLNYHDEDTLDLLCDSMVESEESRITMNRILAYTQFLAREK